MINPILLENRPLFVKDNWTVMVMDLSVEDEDYTLVRTTLQQIHPEMLLFTRRLRKIDISLEQHLRSKTETRVYCVNMPNDEFPCVYAIQGKKSANYFVHKIYVHDMPEHQSRPSVRKSRIVLAFPFNETHDPIIVDQYIFIFMPLRVTSLPVNLLASFI